MEVRVVSAGVDPGHEVVDVEGLLPRRYDLAPGTTYLFRPDQHVAARWRRADAAALRAAVLRAMGRESA